MTDQQQADLVDLINRPQFLRLMWRTIQKAGIFSATANGSDGRNLYLEGRRSLGLELLRELEEAMPVQFPDGDPGMILSAILHAAAQSQAPEKPNGRRSDPYRDLASDGDAQRQ